MTALTPSCPAAAQGTSAALELSRLMGPAAWNRLTPAIRRRFAAGHADVSYRGQLSLERSRAGRCFAAAVRLLNSPLVSAVEADAPAEVRVSCTPEGGVVWERQLTLATQARTQCVRSVKQMGADGRLEERTSGGLGMTLQVTEECGALVFYSRRYFLALGPLRLPIPAWLTPGPCRVEHRDEGPGRFRFTLEMRHPLLGRTFFQTGLFTDPEEIPS